MCFQVSSWEEEREGGKERERERIFLNLLFQKFQIRNCLGKVGKLVGEKKRSGLVEK